MTLTECRYCETGAEYWLTVYNYGDLLVSNVRDMEGKIEERPQWLTDIRNVALLGDHIVCPSDPPPSIIFWFFVDEYGKLAAFPNIKEGSHDPVL